MTADIASRDSTAVEPRQAGRSFAAIADALGYEQAGKAQRAFIRGLRRRPKQDQLVIRQGENRRLDRLEKYVRSRTDLTDGERESRLKAIERLRVVNGHTRRAAGA
jgi:hypothetical protein